MTPTLLDLKYEGAATVAHLFSRIQDCVESLSLEFEQYENDHARGPSL